MITSKRILLVLMTLLIVLGIVTGGCSTTARKPANPSSPQNLSPTPMTPQSDPATASRQAVVEAAKITGVKTATAFISDKNLYIGLDLKANPNLTPAAIEKSVMDQVKFKQPGYMVMATSDQETVARIKTITQGIAQGKPLSDYTSEINYINMKLMKK